MERRGQLSGHQMLAFAIQNVSKHDYNCFVLNGIWFHNWIQNDSFLIQFEIYFLLHYRRIRRQSIPSCFISVKNIVTIIAEKWL